MIANKPLPPLALLLDSNRGIFIPQHFVTQFDLTKWEGINPSDVNVLKSGPEHAHYWEAWDDVTSNATHTYEGNVWRLHQDGDLWAYCFELMTDEEKTNFGMTDD